MTEAHCNTFQLYLEFQGWHNTRRGLQTLELVLQVPQPGRIDIQRLELRYSIARELLCLLVSLTLKGTFSKNYMQTNNESFGKTCNYTPCNQLLFAILVTIQ